MTKKLVVLLAASLLSLGIMTGCSGNSSTSGNTDNVSAQSEEQAAVSDTTVSTESTQAATNDTAAVSTDTSQSTATGNYISEDEASEIALAKVDGATTSDMWIYQDTDDGQTVYEGTILYGGMEYDFEINATTGAIMEWDSEVDDSISTNSSTQNTDNLISETEAGNIALAKVSGATKSDLTIYQDTDDGRTVYEGHIIYNEIEYDFEIDAATGTVLDWEAESIYD